MKGRVKGRGGKRVAVGKIKFFILLVAFVLKYPKIKPTIFYLISANLSTTAAGEN